MHSRFINESGFRRPSKVGSVRRRPALLRLIRGQSGADPTLPITSASPGVALVARAPDNLSAFIMRKAFAARLHCGLSVASLGHLQRQPLNSGTTNHICSAAIHYFRQQMAWSSGNRATVPNFCTAHRRTRQRPHRWQCICCAARRDVALTLVSGAHGVYGLGTVPSEPRQWLRGACGHRIYDFSFSAPI